MKPEEEDDMAKRPGTFGEIDSRRYPDASNPTVESLRAGDRIGEYLLEESIGQGGCGTVWRARHAVLPGVVVAVKLPRDPELIDLLRRESLLQHGLDHPGVLKVLGVDLDAEVPYVVQEYAAGGDLAALLRREGKLPLERTLDIFHEVSQILAHAHAKGVVHCDLKPGNILLDGEGHVRVGDFGLGKGVETLTATALRESIDSLGPHTDGRYLGGTWEYMAPEQKEAGSNDGLDPRVDVFALGIILYEMLTGDRPAGRVDLKLTPDIDTVFARCWTSRDRRYADAGELLKDLRRLRAKKPLAPEKSPVRPEPSADLTGRRRPAKVRWFVWAYVLPLGLLLGALGLVSLNEDRLGRDDLAADGGYGEDFGFAGGDEADELAEIRRTIENEAFTVEDAASLLRSFRAKAYDRRLKDLARRWEDALLTTDEALDYEVRWKRYRIHQGAYRRNLYAKLEPGRPDVYLRVFRLAADGEQAEELVFDSFETPVEAWAFDWSDTPQHPTFRLRWKRGDQLRVELWEQDIFGDNLIAKYELGGELSILVVSSPRTTESGHAIELASDLAFGR